MALPGILRAPEDGAERWTSSPTDRSLVLSGDFDVRSTWEVRNAIYDHLEGHDEDVVVDLTDVTTIDVTALKVLAVATRQASRDGHHLILRGCGPAGTPDAAPVPPDPRRRGRAQPRASA